MVNTMTAEEILNNIEEEKKEDLSHLLDTSYPLLQKFRELAPGTYKHSQALESMIEGVALELGLDVTFMRVAAMYHDTGKMHNPKYFTENQLEDENLHKDLDPWISSQIIRCHVADTVNILINDKNFPRELIELISQHHGTSVIRYFFSKSKDDDAARFRYKCAKPTCVESAALMITDHIEATTRSLNQAGKLDPKEVIDNTIQNLIDDGQLDEVTMKLGDLKRIKLALAKELEGIYQKRVDYDEAEETEEDTKDKN